MSLTVQLESFIQCFAEVSPLFEAHWKKTLHTEKLLPQYHLYFEKELQGRLFYLTLRDNRKLAGYWIAFLSPGHHNASKVVAMCDSWNLCDGYESGAAPLILFRGVDREYRRLGVDRSVAGHRAATPEVARLFAAFKYTPADIMYAKEYSND